MSKDTYYIILFDGTCISCDNEKQAYAIVDYLDSHGYYIAEIKRVQERIY